MKINLPNEIIKILSLLNASGYQAYLVGGCIRDIILNRTVSDWDIVTNATPDQVCVVFSSYALNAYAAKYGTISFSTESGKYEITTMRKENLYADNRRPDIIEFTDNLAIDLKRRDFTINAIAYSLNEGIIDKHKGLDDLKKGVLRTVGNPYDTFYEDHLRIMRAFRFSAQLGFYIEENTLNAAKNMTDKKLNIPTHNIKHELNLSLLGDHFSLPALQYTFIISNIIEEIKPTIGFMQHTPFHNLDIWSHTVKSIEYTPNNIDLKLCMLLHDLGKPHCFTLDKNGIGHFKGHSEKGADLAQKILSNLQYNKHTIRYIYKLIYNHDRRETATYENARKLLCIYGEKFLKDLLTIRRADNMAKNPSKVKEMLHELDKFEEYMQKIIKNGDYLKKDQMAISGNDLKLLGFRNEEIKQTLDALYIMIAENKIHNDRKILFEQAKKIQKEQRNDKI